MERELLRLECLKLASSRHVLKDEVVATARTFENYVLDNKQPQVKSIDEAKGKKPLIRSKDSDNADILS